MTEVTPQGLSSEEVRRRQRDGRVNTAKTTVTKPVSRILIDNICTFFNLFNLIIALALIAVRSYHNLMFLGVVLVNTVIGIVQELRAKHTLEKLSLLSAVKAKVVRDGREREIPLQDVVLDDCIRYRLGDQIGVDTLITDGAVEVNESMLTGEATPVVKEKGDHLLSGSYVVSGSCTGTVEHVGEDNFVSKLTSEAKRYSRTHSLLMTDLNRIIHFTGLFILPFGVMLVIRDYFRETPIVDSITSTAAALIGMMPQGLVLLTTVAMVVGALRLAKRNTLVRELSCIETLSRVDTLCLDKTGTLTKGQMAVTASLPLIPLASPVEPLLRTAMEALGDDNATALAVREYYRDEPLLPYPVCERSPFSSQRKWSAVSFEGIGSLFFGGYDKLIPSLELPQQAQEMERDGKRLLLAAYSQQTDLKRAKEDLTPLLLLVLEDPVREDAPEILKFFNEQGVALRVISGDHPVTVSALAKQAGVPDADNWVDASALRTDEEIAAAAERYTVFGRVLPGQKKRLVTALKQTGHVVAMTGDGVNDVPALKEADCSVAVASGSDAAKQVSQIVLLDSNFASLPYVVMEGRRVVNNITRTASLFLVKTVMSFLISLCAVILPMSYPFEPIQLSVIGLFAESLPGFLLTLEPCFDRVKDDFLRTVMANALPSGVLIAAFAVVVELFLTPFCSLTQLQMETLMVYITGFVWLVQLYRVCQPFTKLRRCVWISMTVLFFSAQIGLSLLLPHIASVLPFEIPPVFVLPTLPTFLLFIALALVTLLFDRLLYKLCRRLLFGKGSPAG